LMVQPVLSREGVARDVGEHKKDTGWWRNRRRNGIARHKKKKKR